MEITQQVRDYAAKLAEKEQVSTSEVDRPGKEQALAEMSEKFLASGAEVYVTGGFRASASRADEGLCCC